MTRDNCFCKLVYISICFLFLASNCPAQKHIHYNSKPALTTESFSSWKSVGWIGISNDGNYVSFIIEDGSPVRKRMIIESTDGAKYFEHPCVDRAWFSLDSKEVIWMKEEDTLCIFSLSDFSLTTIPNVNRFILSDNCLIYLLNNKNKELIIRDIRYGISFGYPFIKGFQVSKNSEKLLLHHFNVSTDQDMEYLGIVNPITGGEILIGRGKGITNIVMDSSASMVSYMLSDGEVYSWNDSVNIMDIKLNILDVPLGARIVSLKGYSRDGSSLFVEISKQVDSIVTFEEDPLTIWSYLSTDIRGDVLLGNGIQSYLSVIDLRTRRMTRLRRTNELIYFPGNDKKSDTLSLVFCQGRGIIINGVDTFGNCGHWELMNNRTGFRNKLDFIGDVSVILLSPELRFIVYYDSQKKNFFSYEIATDSLRNLTDKVDEVWEKNIDIGTYGYQYICAWEKNDSSLLVSGQRDIWQIDPMCLRSPINLTNQCGRDDSINFFLALDSYKTNCYNLNDSIILTGFSPKTKENGFYSIVIGKQNDPKLLTKGAYLYCITDNPTIPSGLNFSPIKAKHASKYVVRRMSATEAPNYFFTSDFVSFRALSNIQPQKSYNWYQTELHNWRSLNSEVLSGILYKPEDFDSTRRYPVIFYFYERMSDRLNAYLKPEYLTGGGALNIAYYVSNGYLIFCPDIRYTVGAPMKGTFDAIVAAGDYLKKLKFVDSTSIGIQGTSWGGIQVNYLVTHTSMFAAACSVSGLSNWISGYGSLILGGVSAHEVFESGQLRVGGSLWDKQEVYLSNSAVLNAKSVTTPILMMHTTNDELCPFSNAIEFFTALRRLGKKSWLLEYNGNHILHGKEVLDFSFRMRQFFDHYLMAKPAPRWMTRSFPVKYLEDRNDLELDNSIATPMDGLVY